MTQEEVRRLFDYCPSGNLIWKDCSVKRLNGEIAGSLHHTGYVNVGIKRIYYGLHRLIWLYHNGPIPNGLTTDHINGDKTDNRIENIQICTKSNNMHKSRIRSDNKSGMAGVHYHKGNKMWYAYVRVMDELIHLGSYIDKKDAIAARIKGEITHCGAFAPSLHSYTKKERQCSIKTYKENAASRQSRQ